LEFATILQPRGLKGGVVAKSGLPPEAEEGDLEGSPDFATGGAAEGEIEEVVAKSNPVPEGDLPLSGTLQPPPSAHPREGLSDWLDAFGGQVTGSEP